MIYKNPEDWQELQNLVLRIFQEIGMIAEKEKVINTPRGNIEIDVFAIDPFSIDNIKYIVECKNWKNSIPQTVIHSFTTVMNETGGNIGYIISKNGFQDGAYSYIQNTNIKLYTFEEFQFRYATIWAKKQLSKIIYEQSEEFIIWTLNVNQNRSYYTYYEEEEKSLKLYEILKKHKPLRDIIYFIITFYDNPNNNFYDSHLSKSFPPHLDHIKELLLKNYNYKASAQNYNDLAEEFKTLTKKAIEELNSIYGKNISI